MHPIFLLLINRPELALEHLSGYTALAQEEASKVGLAIARRTIAWVVAILAFTVFLILAGVAVMLAYLQGQIHWSLLVVPAAALLLALLAWLVASQRLPSRAFTQLKAQLDADAQALRAAEIQP